MSVAVQFEGVWTNTATETVDESTPGVKIFEVPICCGAPPTKKV